MGIVLQNWPWIHQKDATLVAIAAAITGFAFRRFPALCITLPLVAGFATQQFCYWRKCAKTVQIKAEETNNRAAPEVPDDVWLHGVLPQLRDSEALVPLAATSRQFRRLVLRFKTPDNHGKIQGTPFGALRDNFCEMAAASGNQELLEWGRNNFLPFSMETTRQAALRGDLPMMQWLRARGCRWNAGVTTAAAVNGYIALYRWAVANHCLVNSSSITNQAAKQNKVAVLQWADVEKMIDGYEDEIFFTALSAGSLDVVKWLNPRVSAFGKHCAFFYAMPKTTLDSPGWDKLLPLLTWLRDNNFTIDESNCRSAALRGNLQLLQWLRANECHWNYPKMIKIATKNQEKYPELYQWVVDNRPA